MMSSGSAAKSDSESKFDGLAGGLKDEGWLGGHTEFIDSSLPDSA